MYLLPPPRPTHTSLIYLLSHPHTTCIGEHRKVAKVDRVVDVRLYGNRVGALHVGDTTLHLRITPDSASPCDGPTNAETTTDPIDTPGRHFVYAWLSLRREGQVDL